MKRIIIITLLFFNCTNKKFNSETNTSDSLPIYLNLANQDSIYYKKRIDYNNKALRILLDQENDSLNRKNLFQVANRFYNMNQFEKYFKVTKIISENSISANDTENIAKAYSYLGDYYTNTSKKDSAFLFYTKAEKLYLKLKDNVNLGNVYISIAILQNYENDLLGSEASAIQALNVLRRTSEKAKIYEAYNILGASSYGLKNYDKSIEYHTKALNLAEENNLTTYHENASSLNNLGGVYQKQNRHVIAISMFQEALKNKNLFIEKPKLYATLINNLAYSKLKLKDFSYLPDLFYKSLKIRDSLGLKPGIIYNKIHLSEFYAVKEDTLNAQKFAKEALELSRAIKSKQDLLLSLKQIGSVDPKHISIYSSEYIKISDSLQLEERKIQNKFARIDFETDEIIVQKEAAVKNQWLIFLVSSCIILLVLLFYIIRMQRTKQKELKFIQSQQKASEEIYQLLLDQQSVFNEGRENEKRRIAKELHDGVMNRLAGIRFNLFILEKRNDAETILKCIKQVSELQMVEKEIRNIAHNLDSDDFNSKNDYPELLKTLIENYENLGPLNIKYTIDQDINWETIPSIIKMHFYRILQEGIGNTIKHSNSSELAISIRRQDKILTVKISDNGNGFDPMGEVKSIGLKNIKSRVKEMNGNCEISSSESGTIIFINIPI